MKTLWAIDRCILVQQFRCSSADFDDMAAAYGVFSLQGQASLDQIYIGWRGEVSSAIWDKFADDITFGIELFWKHMGNGEGLKQAFDATATDDGGKHPKTPTSLWGDNGTIEFFNDHGDDNLFLLGDGSVDISKIKLEY